MGIGASADASPLSTPLSPTIIAAAVFFPKANRFGCHLQSKKACGIQAEGVNLAEAQAVRFQHLFELK